MKISFNWLKQYFPKNSNDFIAAEEVAVYLTDCGLEVEGIYNWQSVEGGLKGVITGEIKTCIKHPGSDHLSITTVDVGREELLNIVCGASNVAAGQKVVVATVGTVLTFGGKELIIQKSKIRGEVSEGMICAEDELGIGTSHAGIMVLDESVKPGISASELFGIEEDTVFEIGLTPNRSDAVSHTGVARDLAAVLNITSVKTLTGKTFFFTKPDVSQFKIDNNNRSTKIVIEDAHACPRYSGLTITGISVKESPGWLKNRLNAIGLRPINNIVDITNYILHELGQPLHAFDADRIEGGTVVVKKLPAGTKFITLDGIERKLTSQDLMICDIKSPMVIAGVFGGIASGVTEETKNIFLESATFEPQTIRKTSRHHGLQTDASFRFERGTDIDINIYALKRAALLIKEVAGGDISSEIIDVYPHQKKEAEVFLSRRNIDRLTGKILDTDEVTNILKSLFINVMNVTEKGWELIIPNFKVDVTREADVIEEVLRIFGYNNIAFSDHIKSPLSTGIKPDPEKIQNVTSDYLVGNGFSEIMNNSLTRSAYYKGDDVFPMENSVRILNPLSRDLDVMRQTLLYGGLETVIYNQNRKVSDQKLFEFGNCYRKVTLGKSGNPLESYSEEKHLSILITGNKYPGTWNNSNEKTDFYFLKSYVQNILAAIGFKQNDSKQELWNSAIISEGLRVLSDKKVIVSYGKIAKNILKQFDIKQDVFYADFSWTNILSVLSKEDIGVKELPKFPEVRRDLALVLEKSVTFAEIEKVAGETEKNILKSIGLFDVYEGDKIESGKKSYAIYFILADDRKTLTEKEIDKTMNKLIRAFEEKLKARLRGPERG